ncbi:MAG: hypothetical protein EOP49_11885 [Sphingobacteriales bacterium]|nr:MAG: hypothetical protein EOP49_11885 [Sphingobacteriales bacterium]
MQNELASIGTLIYEMRHNRLPEPGDESFKALEGEFNRISQELGTDWLEQVPGGSYQLEFHRSEALRLLNYVEELIAYSDEMGCLIPDQKFIGRVYIDLTAHLVELVTTIDQMAADRVVGSIVN